MACDLERIYSNLASQLPETLDCNQPFLLDESTIPPAPAEMSTDKLVMRKSWIERLPGCRGDLVDVIAPRSTIRQLGLAALAVLFHEQRDRTVIHMVGENSTVRHVILGGHAHVPKEKCRGFQVRPWALGYLPEEPSTVFPWESSGSSAPIFRLTNLSDCLHDETEWRNRDTVWGFGDTFSTADVAQFLLDIGRSQEKRGCFVIPANSAFFAAEVTIWDPENWRKVREKLAERNRNQ